ncbi:hypothetical protein J6590_075392 [Homalodisca vitripennis]|nr:hypothetical protein J6590_075392 [Homalodisca vitripennis]
MRRSITPMEVSVRGVSTTIIVLNCIILTEEIQTACEVKEENNAGEPDTVPIVTADDVKSIPHKKKKICKQPVKRSIRLFLNSIKEQDKSKHYFKTELNQGTCGSGSLANK